jgi:hypothetical protein
MKDGAVISEMRIDLPVPGSTGVLIFRITAET